MKKATLSLLVVLGLLATSCKGKKTESSDTTTTTTAAQTTPAAPVEISSDDQLKSGVNDATKDFPGVQASVNNGEVTLTGTIKRERLQQLMQAVQALHPKKVNNQLTVQP